MIEYYTREWGLKREKLKAEAPSVKLRKPSKKAVLAKVDKAERDLEALVQGVSDVAAAQRFTQALIQHAQRTPEPEFDFMRVAQDYRERMRRDDEELLLLSMVI